METLTANIPLLEDSEELPSKLQSFFIDIERRLDKSFFLMSI